MACSIEYLADHVDAIPQLARWHHAEWSAINPHASIADREAHFHTRARRGQVPTAFVALSDGQVVGLASLVETDLDSHRHLSPWLASVLVAPEHRGHGIGSALSERVVAEARRLGFLDAYLFTFDKARFYQRLGWSVLEAATYQTRPVTVMVRSLAGDESEQSEATCTA